MNEILTAIFIVLGTFFCALAALGIVRMPDFYSRMQATTKGTTLGAGLIMIAVAIFFAEGPPVTRAIAVILFLFVTSPVSGQMLSRAAYLLGTPLWSKTQSDALDNVYTGSTKEESDSDL